MDLDDLIKAGRVAPVFCRLARQRFSGVVFVEHAEQGGIFSFRDGDPVFVEDLGDNDEGIPDQLVAEGLVTAQQYTEIATRVTEALVESEEVAFCQVAVELGILSQERVNTILQRRVKGRVIQAIGWSGCEIEVDDDPDGLAGILEYPQELGPLVYMGVRTFFDEEQISEIVGRRGQTYLRLAGAVDEPVEFFGLDDEERNLLERLLPDVSVEAAMEAARVDPLDAWQVVCLLSIAGFVELSDVPFSAPSEGSGVRDTSAMRAAAGRYTGGAVSEERVGVRPPARHPAAEGRVAGARAPARPPVAEERTGVRGPARPPVAEERVGPAARANGSRSDARPSASDAAGAAARRGRDAQAPVRSVDDSARSSSSQGRPTPPGQRIRERRRRPRKLSTALKRLDRELKNRRPASGPQASSAASKGQPPRRAHTPASTPKGSGSASRQDRAHIKALLRMRQASLTKRIRSENVAPP
ncbi:MAG: hypothetical protein PVI30_21290, partial [Myxococcales bacterium]